MNNNWRGGEVVTLRSAKPTRAGSIPAHASAMELLNCLRSVRDRKPECIAKRLRGGVEKFCEATYS